MGRTAAGLALGILVAVTVVALVEAFGHWLYPPPPDIDLSNPRALETLMASLPAGAIAAVLLAWAAGSFCGGATGAMVAGRRWVALAIGLVILVAGAATMVMIPHPAWFVALSLPAAVLPAWLGGRLVPTHGLGMPEKK